MSRSIIVDRFMLRAAATDFVLGLAGCGGQGLAQTGFHDNYDRLQTQPYHTRHAIYVKPGFSASNCTEVIVEPVAWMPAPETLVHDEETMATLQGNLHDALAKPLLERLTVVEDPGAGRNPASCAYAAPSQTPVAVSGI